MTHKRTGEARQTIKNISLQHAGRNDRGARREQQDAYGVRYLQRHKTTGATSTNDASEQMASFDCDAELLAVLADGMGGHTGGAIASRTSCDSFISSYQELTGGYGDRLLHALDQSNKAVASGVEADLSLRGMGCTLLAVSVSRSGARWVSVGDSLLYLYRNEKLTRLNEDHSLAPILNELVQQGEMTATEADHHPKRSMLRSAVTGDEIELVDLKPDPVKLMPGDWLILASDGLLSLSLEHIANIIRLRSPFGANRLTEALIAAIREKGAPDQDNTTVLAIGYDTEKNV